MSKVLENFTIDEVFVRALDGNKPYPHQLETARNLIEGKSVVLRAPCGSGKTEACYVSLLLGKGILPDRLLYSLPTRALVEDVSYRIKKGISKIGLPPIASPQHGANSEDPLFKSEIVVSTIDQTVGAYCCTPLSLPVYLGNIPAGAAVSSFLCFDEAHVYDHMLGLQTMLVLVERSAELGLPFLVMSATLPDSFIEWFKSNETFSDRIAVVEGKDEDVPKRQNRHVILKLKDKLLECTDVLDCANLWRRIMVVCNTVDRAQELFGLVKEALKNDGFDVFLLHSRFLDEDREVVEDKMKACLKDSDKKTCLITTQVCEVGLDISCDLLLTELAPPDSLIQRIGRCAREGKVGEVWVFDVEYCAPYSNEEMLRSREYVCERLDGRRIGWSEELEFVNTLLGEEFKQIMNNEKLRLNILKSLGDSAFNGDRKGIEDCVRDVLSANITIHDNPRELKSSDLLGMPWIDVDVRVLNNRLKRMNAEFWLVKFERDEEGRLQRQLFMTSEALPYEYYVISPHYVAYSTELGLMLVPGRSSIKFETSEEKTSRMDEWISRDETWVDHIDTCLKVFDIMKFREVYSLKLLAKLLGLSVFKAEGVVALCLALHDVGKLNVSWQKSFGIKASDPFPIAKATKEKRKTKPPPHAAISAYATYRLLEALMKNDIRKTYALHLAIGHHHHTRAEKGCDYVLGWPNVIDKKIMEVSTKYDLKADVSLIRNQDYDANLTQSFPGIEKTDEYSIYCIVSRFIRLCDRIASKEGGKL